MVRRDRASDARLLTALAALTDAVRLLAGREFPTLPLPVGPQSRLILALDIIAFNHPLRDDEIQAAMRQALYRSVVGAFAAAALRWHDSIHEDRGGGVLITLAADTPLALVTGPLLAYLESAIRLHNRLVRSLAEFRLRAALHIGEVSHDEYGMVGRAVNHTFWMLEAPAFKRHAAQGGAALNVVMSDTLHRLLGHDAGRGYGPIPISIKETCCTTWLRHPPPVRPALAQPQLAEPDHPGSTRAPQPSGNSSSKPPRR